MVQVPLTLCPSEVRVSLHGSVYTLNVIIIGYVQVFNRLV